MNPHRTLPAVGARLLVASLAWPAVASAAPSEAPRPSSPPTTLSPSYT